MALIGTGFGIQVALRMRAEETSGRLEPLLATALSARALGAAPTSRSRWAARCSCSPPTGSASASPTRSTAATRAQLPRLLPPRSCPRRPCGCSSARRVALFGLVPRAAPPAWGAARRVRAAVHPRPAARPARTGCSTSRRSSTSRSCPAAELQPPGRCSCSCRGRGADRGRAGRVPAPRPRSLGRPREVGRARRAAAHVDHVAGEQELRLLLARGRRAARRARAGRCPRAAACSSSGGPLPVGRRRTGPLSQYDDRRARERARADRRDAEQRARARASGRRRAPAVDAGADRARLDVGLVRRTWWSPSATCISTLCAGVSGSGSSVMWCA